MVIYIILQTRLIFIWRFDTEYTIVLLSCLLFSAQSFGLSKSGPTAGARGTFNPRMLQSRRDESDAVSVRSMDSGMSL